MSKQKHVRNVSKRKTLRFAFCEAVFVGVENRKRLTKVSCRFEQTQVVYKAGTY